MSYYNHTIENQEEFFAAIENFRSQKFIEFARFSYPELRKALLRLYKKSNEPEKTFLIQAHNQVLALYCANRYERILNRLWRITPKELTTLQLESLYYTGKDQTETRIQAFKQSGGWTIIRGTNPKMPYAHKWQKHQMVGLYHHFTSNRTITAIRPIKGGI